MVSVHYQLDYKLGVHFTIMTDTRCTLTLDACEGI